MPGRAAIATALVVAVLSGCGGGGGSGPTGDVDLAAARGFEEHPLYWLGDRFEDWDLTYVSVGNGEFSTFIYGRCEASSDGGCAPPLQLQIQRLCAHLDAVAQAPIWRTRRVRGAPVGTIDSAPVLFSSRVQVKVYRGRGSDPGVEMRALRALRSVNDVEPVLGANDPIPPADLDVLAGKKPCRH
jgi:hypothetical protein